MYIGKISRTRPIINIWKVIIKLRHDKVTTKQIMWTGKLVNYYYYALIIKASKIGRYV